MGGTPGSCMVSSAADVLEISAMRGVRGVGGVCDMCMCLGCGGVEDDGGSLGQAQGQGGGGGDMSVWVVSLDYLC